MVGKDREGQEDVPGTPSAWEIPSHIISIAERIKESSGTEQVDYAGILYHGVSGAFTKLLEEASYGEFQAGAQGQEVKSLYPGYALHVFRKPDRHIFALRLSMAIEDQGGSIYFTVEPGSQKPKDVEVNSRLSGKDENGLTFQSSRKLLMLCEGDEIAQLNLDVSTHERFTLKPVSSQVA